MALPAARICCLDLDTFFVSVERLLNPELAGKPVIVGGRPGQRGVVTAASYEVRALGVRSGMPLARAVELAPDAIYLPTRHGVYGPYAERVRTLAQRFTPSSQVASIDEMFLDFSGCERLYKRADDASADATIARVVRELTDAIQTEIGLPASAGIAASRSVAKIASGLAKPRGVLLVPVGAELEFLAPLPVRKFPGIGPVAEQKLHALGFTTLGQVAAAPADPLRRVFGAFASAIQRGCRGQGPHQLGRERPAFQEYDPEDCAVGSISNERTFGHDVRDRGRIHALLCGLCERVCWRARSRHIEGRTVTLKLRYSNFDTYTRSRSITPTCSERELFPVVLDLFERNLRRGSAVRLLGVALSNLRPHAAQLPLFENDSGLHAAVDSVRERFGFDALRSALSLGRNS